MKGPRNGQLKLFGRVSTTSHSAECASFASRPGPASLEFRAIKGVSTPSQDLFVVGLDTGERDGKTVASFPDETVRCYGEPLHAILDSDVPDGARVVTERSVYAFRTDKRATFVEAARRRSIDLYFINPRITSGRRRDWFPDEEKSDELDAKVLRMIGEDLAPFGHERSGQPLIPRTKLSSPKLSDDLLTRLRQTGYDLNHPGVPEYFREAIRTLLMQPAPECAHTCSVDWAVADYRLFTVVAVALEARCKRDAKAAIRRRGLARSNLMYHPMKKRDQDQRRAIMKAQWDLIRYVFDELKGRKAAAA